MEVGDYYLFPVIDVISFPNGANGGAESIMKYYAAFTSTLLLDTDSGDLISDSVNFIPCADITDPLFPAALIVNITS
jgi:hypothetical protein